MSKHVASVAPLERINIKYVPAVGDDRGEVELPLKLMVVGNFKGHVLDQAIEERPALRIDKNTFDTVMEKADLVLNLDMPSSLASEHDDATSLQASLTFRSLQDFGPDAIAGQVPELRKLLELREALVALKGPLGNMPEFRARLQALISNDAARQQLGNELTRVLGHS